MRHRILIAGAALSLTLVIAGCATPTDAAGPSSPTPTPTAVATPSATPEPAACETAFTDAEYARLEADGLTFRGGARLDEALPSLADTGGISCLWRRPATDAEARYAQWPSDQATWESLRAELLGDGYLEIEDPFPGIIQSPPDPEFQPALTYRDGVVYYVSIARLFSSVAALQ